MNENEWDDHADDWDVNEDVQLYARKAFESWQEKVAPLYQNLSECRALDFGCGTGLLTERLAGHCAHVVAADTSEKMIEVLQNKLDSADIGNVTASSVPIDAHSIEANPELLSPFDLIVASSVCSFLPDYESTLRDISSLLKSGAYFVQWDWLESMPGSKIEGAFKSSGLISQSIGQAFAMGADGESRPVIMGIGRKPY